MRRQMRSNRINFFESPHPRHIDFAPIREDRLQLLEDIETPVANSPLPNLARQTPCQSPFFRYFEGFNFSGAQAPREEEQSLEINQKLQYSQQQDLLLALTPKKEPIIQEENENTATARKVVEPVSEAAHSTQVRFYERGLKKLAYEAFQFVSHQRKTSYKEVALRLISQISDDHELELHKKGQMNIKRRIYDALNVLIALGLLKRSGNKILSKKCENDIIERDFEPESDMKRQRAKTTELQALRQQFGIKNQLITQKQQCALRIQQKLNKIAELIQKNKTITEKPKNDLKNQSSKLDGQTQIFFPIFALCLNESTCPGNSRKSWISKQDSQKIQLRMQNRVGIQIFGDLDLIEKYSAKDTEKIYQRQQRIKRRSR